MVDTLSEEREAFYGRALKGVLERDTRIRESGVPAEALAAKVEVALRSLTPKPEYKLGISPRLSS